MGVNTFLFGKNVLQLFQSLLRSEVAGGQQQSAVRTYTSQPELEYTRLLAQTHQLSERLLVLRHTCFPVAVLCNF